ncbi:MAG: preprotein translocase subunit SecE [Phycisphaerae bacterium]|jgi:preprotein translocase subunit SecE
MADETLAPERVSRPASAGSGGASPLRPYKPGQGRHVRWGTAGGAGVIAVAGAMFVYDWLAAPFGGNSTSDVVLRTLIPVVLLIGAAWLIWWLTGTRRGSVDFMIATEGEMKKVNWSSRREVFGATKVVIFTVLAMGMMLAVVDFVFMGLFALIGVLKVPFWQQIFGSGGA